MQYIQQGILEIDTTNAIWMHKLATNGSMAYSYYGEIEPKTLPGGNIQYNVSKFEFQTPILINGSAAVKLTGSHSLFLSSKEGIFIGADIDVGKTRPHEERIVGGFCVSGSEASGKSQLWNTLSVDSLFFMK